MSYESDFKAGRIGGPARDSPGWHEGNLQRLNEAAERQRRRVREEAERERQFRDHWSQDKTSFTSTWSRYGGNSASRPTVGGWAQFFGCVFFGLACWYGLTQANWSVPEFVLYSGVYACAGAVLGAAVYVALRLIGFILSAAIILCLIAGLLHVSGILDATPLYYFIRNHLGH